MFISIGIFGWLNLVQILIDISAISTHLRFYTIEIDIQIRISRYENKRQS
jgi:hypothetical protein